MGGLDMRKRANRKVSFRGLVQLPSTTYATFGLYRYPAKFIPHVVAYVMEKHAKPGVKVFDPFAGYGTVGIVSRIYGHDYELWDLNPMLKTLHAVATMGLVKADKKNIIREMKASEEKFVPQWSNLDYWFPEDFIPFLCRAWGYYHSLNDKSIKRLLTIPLLKTTRYFSYDDMQRQKLSKSPISKKRVESLLSSNWKNTFFQTLEKEIDKVVRGLHEYQKLRPKNTKGTIRAGVDTMKQELKEKKDILITSPPYLQSQEYIRQAKHDLFWLGYPEKKIKELSKLEIPYRAVEPCPVYSKTFSECEGRINEEHIRKVFDRYFWGVLGTLTRLQKNISSRMFLFVGHTSTRGRSVPLDRIFIEHLTEFGWAHEKTLSDTIVSRRLFSYKVNPASKIKDMRTPVENLVFLKKT